MAFLNHNERRIERAPSGTTIGSIARCARCPPCPDGAAAGEIVGSFVDSLRSENLVSDPPRRSLSSAGRIVTAQAVVVPLYPGPPTEAVISVSQGLLSARGRVRSCDPPAFGVGAALSQSS